MSHSDENCLHFFGFSRFSLRALVIKLGDDELMVYSAGGPYRKPLLFKKNIPE
jgi:hypothetical protein